LGGHAKRSEELELTLDRLYGEALSIAVSRPQAAVFSRRCLIFFGARPDLG
jgi:hypothetical protein